MATAMKWRIAAMVMGAGAVLWSGGTALGQNNRNGNNTNRNAPPDPNAPLADRLLPHGKTKEWVMIVDVYYPGQRLNAPPVDRWGVIRPDFSYPGRTITMDEWNRVNQQAQQGVKFDTAAMVFPVPLATAGHTSSMGTFSSEIKVDSIVVPTEVKFTDGYQSGERLARWDLRDVNARQLNLHVEIPVTCWETLFNEAEAMKIDWPKSDWPAIAKSALEPVYLVEWSNEEKEIADNKKLLDELQKRWLNGRDPKTIKPVMLAKELAGRVMEFCDPSGGDTVYGTLQGTFQGLLTKTVGEIINGKRCYKLDPPNLLSAVYRNAGLPARTVYGYDMTDEKSNQQTSPGNAKITAWTEFAVIDDKTGSVVWIPVDVINMRRSGSRMQRLDRTWKYFGSNENLVYMIPISFHAHPPTGVTVRSLPAFWGWLCTPETPPLPHSLQINAMSQNSREKQKNEQDKNKNQNPNPPKSP